MTDRRFGAKTNTTGFFKRTGVLNKTMAQNFLNQSIDSNYRSNGSSLDRNKRNNNEFSSESRQQSNLDIVASGGS